MDYSTTFFNKELENLEYQDILNFFSEAKEESTRIEFKGFSSEFGNFTENLNGIIRGICAFLNSEGGILIWGAPIGVPGESGQSSKIFKGALSPLTDLKDKDWLINKISDLITPLPIGIDLKILQNNAEVLYVFEIQESNYSPHQFKNTYWARLDGQTKPAPHYLIDALFKKIRYPNIEGFVKLDKISHNQSAYYLDITVFNFNFSPLQNEIDLSFRLMCPQGKFNGFNDSRYAHMYMFEGHQLVNIDYIKVLHFGAPNMHSARLIFDPYEVSSKFSNQVDLLLTFGGRFSPLKTSTYKLDFGKLNWNITDNPNYLFSFVEENKLSATKQEELGTTRENTLEIMLNRKFTK